MWDWLKRLDRSGGTLAWILTILTTQWGVIVSALVAFAVAAFTWTSDFVHRTEVQTAAAVFLVLLWTYIGVSTVSRRKRPIIIRHEEEYSYTLLHEGINFGFDPDNVENCLQLGINLRNVGTLPMLYVVESLQVVIGDRTVTKKEYKNNSGIMARFGARVFRDTGFRRDAIKELFDTEVAGSIKYSIAYGPPDAPSVRRLKLEIEIGMRLALDPTKRGFSDTIISELDQPV
jgi:hypothetical protein